MTSSTGRDGTDSDGTTGTDEDRVGAGLADTCWALVIGDPLTGYRLRGPFDDPQTAELYGESRYPNDTWWVTVLQPGR